MGKRYSVSAISVNGSHEYVTDEIARAEKKANAWASHGWSRVTIFDHMMCEFIRK